MSNLRCTSLAILITRMQRWTNGVPNLSGVQRIFTNYRLYWSYYFRMGMENARCHAVSNLRNDKISPLVSLHYTNVSGCSAPKSFHPINVFHGWRWLRTPRKKLITVRPAFHKIDCRFIIPPCTVRREDTQQQVRPPLFTSTLPGMSWKCPSSQRWTRGRLREPLASAKSSNTFNEKHMSQMESSFGFKLRCPTFNTLQKPDNCLWCLWQDFQNFN